SGGCSASPEKTSSDGRPVALLGAAVLGVLRRRRRA
ncbi:MAG: MYXO-CTERM sorting domain-containing protein, partial [Polyangiales bacterium]